MKRARDGILSKEGIHQEKWKDHCLSKLAVPHSFYDKNGPLDTIYMIFNETKWYALLDQHESLVIVSLDFERIYIRIKDQFVYCVGESFFVKMQCDSIFPSDTINHYFFNGLKCNYADKKFWISNPPTNVHFCYTQFLDPRTYVGMRYENQLQIQYTLSYSRKRWIKHHQESSLKWLFIIYLLDFHQVPPEVICHFREKRMWALDHVDNSFEPFIYSQNKC